MTDLSFEKQKLVVRSMLLCVLTILGLMFYLNRKEAAMGEVSFAKIIFMTNIICTYIMVGIIWIIQIVNYRMFNRIGREAFADYHKKHVWLVTLVVGPPMLLEAISSVAMLWYPMVALNLIWQGVILIFVIWLSTLFFMVPQHDALSKGFSAKAYSRINAFNWIRTIAWSLRAVVVTVMLSGFLGA